MRRAGAIVCLALALGVLGYWVFTGAHWFTRTEIPVETTVVDDFGDEEVKVVWKETYELGLLDRAGPVAGGLLVLAGLLWFLDKRKRNRPPVL